MTSGAQNQDRCRVHRSRVTLSAIVMGALLLGMRLVLADGSPVTGLSDKTTRFFEKAKTHWAYQPLGAVTPPTVRDPVMARNDIDRFILSRIEETGLEASPEADRGTLIRRVTLDLTGLPPTPEAVAAFVGDASPQAYERLVDRLLASPHYGERWGRHWLDLARYADSSGFHNDLDRPYAWKYRDYVIRSFNEDKPYARFVAEQLAGDEVPGANEETLVATGFCRNGPSNDDNMGKNPAALAQYRADQLDDVIATTSQVFLGVTLGCARCHDHKTDAFTSRDYYSLLAIFNGTGKYGSPPAKEVAKGTKPDAAAPMQIQALVETSASVPVTRVMLRGLAANLGEEVGPAAPLALAPEPLPIPPPVPGATSSFRRLALARWITAPENGLSWRVLANRVWQHHFGKGLVATPSNFGFEGAPPTHPELLDYLADRLRADQGRLKPLHKLIVMSATYRQSADHRSEAARRDPSNAFLWRMNLRRMEAEVIRDSILAASGKLNPQAGGPGIKPRLRPDLIPASQRNKWPALDREDERQWRRSVYIYAKRQLLLPMMELFDAPTTTDSCALRAESVVPTQALVLMNDDFVEEQAGHLARRVLAATGDDLPSAVAGVFSLILSAPPGPEKAAQATAFLQAREALSDRQSALTDLAHVLFNSSEFIHIP